MGLRADRSGGRRSGFPHGHRRSGARLRQRRASALRRATFGFPARLTFSGRPWESEARGTTNLPKENRCRSATFPPKSENGIQELLPCPRPTYREAISFCLGKPGAENSERKKAEKQAKPTPSRYIPSEVRERVLERAGYQCEYRGPDGVRCSCRTGLQIEHTKPFAVWRSHDERFLKAFCPAHNRYAAKKFYGPELIQTKIEARRNGVGVGGGG